MKKSYQEEKEPRGIGAGSPQKPFVRAKEVQVASYQAKKVIVGYDFFQADHINTKLIFINQE